MDKKNGKKWPLIMKTDFCKKKNKKLVIDLQAQDDEEEEEEEEEDDEDECGSQAEFHLNELQ